VAPDYRKAKTRPYPAGFQDCYDTLMWASDHAEHLGIRPEKFILGGHSAGGGLTAAVALKATDTQEVDVAFQMPFFPMIDDTQPDDPARNIDPPVWDTALNRIGWGAYLRDIRKGHVELDAYAAPARAASYRGLPPTITYVGSKDPFFWETQTYVTRLRAEGVEVTDCVYEGCYHAFEFLGDGGAIGAEARRFAFDTYAEYYDRYTVP
jgi:acetyl esterase/lipase